MRILIVLEGERTEPDFFQSILQRFELNAELCVVGTNLYTLYHKCKEYFFDCDIKDVLKELIRDDETKKRLDQKFAYTYLVFDADLHHKAPEQRGLSVSTKELLADNFPKLIEMAEHFTDETDLSIGRLYINYPMMESFRYCNTFDDDQYLSATIPIAMLGKFKSLASQMKLSGIAVTEYKKEDFIKLMQMNIKRLKNLSEDCPNILSYQTYQSISVAQEIAAKQYDIVQDKQELWVLNTCLFLILDYFGNKNGFYDSIIS